MNATKTKSPIAAQEKFVSLDAIARELFPAEFVTDHTDGVIAIMGSSPSGAFLYRCGRNSLGWAATPTGWYTYYVVRDGDVMPQKMTHWSANRREECTWEEIASVLRQVSQGTWLG